MKKIILSVILLLIFSSYAHAQTVTQQLAWTQPSDTLTVVNTYKYNLVIDTAAPIIITPTCVQNGVNVDCVSQVVTITLVPHVIKLTVTSISGLSNTATLNYTPGMGPTTIQSFSVITKITVP